MLAITRFDPSHKGEWDRFLATARNGVFLFARDYMEYHLGPFVDHSLLFHEAGRLVALLPASLHEQNTLISHGGLTFGGIVSDGSMTTGADADALQRAFSLPADADYPPAVQACPHIYHEVPAEEDLYALFRAHTCARHNVTFSIAFWRNDCLFKSTVAGASRRPTPPGWGARCVGGASWSTGRWSRFPAPAGAGVTRLTAWAIRCCRAGSRTTSSCLPPTAGRSLAGVLVYENRRVAHAQYISASEEGKRLGHWTWCSASSFPSTTATTITSTSASPPRSKARC